MVKVVWAGLGLGLLAIGLVGIALPLVPTAPFVLLAGVCFARGSHRLHAWLNGHPVFGRLCYNGRNTGPFRDPPNVRR